MTATKQWPPPQAQIVDDQQTSFMASNNKVIMEKPNLDQDQQRRQPLKCPRCESSNTKFCYYNNYSLSQPRHFCKGCKRYWTRGGTLRNVPIGGGCRKIKKIKRHAPPSIGGDGVKSSAAPAAAASTQSLVDQSSTSNRVESLVLYSNHGLNFPFSSFNSSTRVSDSNGFDYQPPQMCDLGLGFVQRNEHKNGLKQIEELNGSLSLSSSCKDLISYGSSAFAASNSTVTSLLAASSSTLQHPKFLLSGLKEFPSSKNFSAGLVPYSDIQMPNVNGIAENDARTEGPGLMASWNEYYPVDQQINSSDFSSLLWSSANVGSWFDPSNMGSSVPSLI